MILKLDWCICSAAKCCADGIAYGFFKWLLLKENVFPD